MQRQVKHHYDEWPRWGRGVDEANRERVEETLRLVPSDVRTVLDLGCGDGMGSKGMVAKGMDVTGLDFSRVALQYFEGKRMVANMADLPFPDRSFDLILCAEVLEHLPGRTFEKALEEIERVAARYVIISTPNEEYLPAGNVKCPCCGCIYHKNYHVRTVDKAMHRGLFKK